MKTLENSSNKFIKMNKNGSMQFHVAVLKGVFHEIFYIFFPMLQTHLGH